MFNWRRIVEQFEKRFLKAFSNNKKAHFDNVPDEYRVVDGARVKWCNLLLLDAIINVLKQRGMTNSTRRTFNQHRVLYDCIFEELKSIDSVAYNEIIGLNQLQEPTLPRTGSSEKKYQEYIEKYTYLTIQELESPWNSMESLCLCLLETPPSKAKAKYVAMVQVLTSPASLLNLTHDLSALVETTIQKVLFSMVDGKHVLPLPEVKTVSTARQLRLSNSSSQVVHDDTDSESSLSCDSHDVVEVVRTDAPPPRKSTRRGTTYKKATPAVKQKRAEERNSSSKRRPSADYNTEYYTSSCASPASLEHFDDFDYDFQTRVAMLFGSSDAAVPVETDSIATQNMKAFSKSPRSMSRAVVPPPLYIPQSQRKLERNARSQNLSCGLTPTVASLKLFDPIRTVPIQPPHTGNDTPSSSPVYQYDSDTGSYYDTRLPDYMLPLDMSRSTTFDDFNLSQEECDLLMDCTVETPREFVTTIGTTTIEVECSDDLEFFSLLVEGDDENEDVIGAFQSESKDMMTTTAVTITDNVKTEMLSTVTLPVIVNKVEPPIVSIEPLAVKTEAIQQSQQIHVQVQPEKKVGSASLFACFMATNTTEADSYAHTAACAALVLC